MKNPRKTLPLLLKSCLAVMAISIAFTPALHAADKKKKSNSSDSSQYVPTPYKAKKGDGKVTITQGGKTISVIKTGRVNVIDYRFIHNQKDIVIKSRGNNGAALIELFETKSGKLQDKIPANKVVDGKPGWAKWAAE